MPQRSNQFQKLIYLIKQQVAKDSEVTESKMLPDSVTGTNREVDIYIESSVAEHTVCICLECRDRKRKADVTWVEEMKSKHERLPTNALVLISSSGFSKEAQKVALIYGFELLSLKEVSEESIEKLFGNLDALWSKVFSLIPTKVVVGIAQTGELPPENIVTFPDNHIYKSNGEYLGTIKEIVEPVLKSQSVAKDLMEKGEEVHKGFFIEWQTPPFDNDDCLYMQKVDPLILRKIDFIRIYGKCSFELTQFLLKHSMLGNIRVSWGEGEFFGKPSILVATENKDGEKKITITAEQDTHHPPT